MIKRYLDCSASELISIDKVELLNSLKLCEGRIIVSETIATVQPVLVTISNAELASSQGADLLLLNMFDVQNPVINGLPPNIEPKDVIKTMRHLTGRVIGVNLEPIDPKFQNHNTDFWSIKDGRVATIENALKLVNMGASFIVLTGNPNNGITNQSINNSLRELRTHVGEKLILIAGKMHAAGISHESGEKIISKADIGEFVKNGADVILIPAPGTVPGITMEYAKQLVEHIHSLGALAMSSIGTSQEGADVETIRQIALMCKMIGVDLHHLGDSGYVGIAIPENIMAYSIAIRGRRHTYVRMARSINR